MDVLLGMQNHVTEKLQRNGKLKITHPSLGLVWRSSNVCVDRHLREWNVGDTGNLFEYSMEQSVGLAKGRGYSP